MNLWNLLLLVLLQSSPTPLSSTTVVAETAAPAPGVNEEKSVPLSIDVVPLSELKQRIVNGDYVPVPRSTLDELQQSRNPSDRTQLPGRQPQIQDAVYKATLTGTKLDSGTVDFQFYPEASAVHDGPLLIGTTSLQKLELSDDQGLVALGADAARRLFVLRPGFPQSLTGTWSAEGLVAGTTVTFRLELPASTTSRLELLTTEHVQISSAGNLVLGPKSEGGFLKWTLIPADTSRLSFTCRAISGLASQSPVALVGFNSTHTVSADILSSRWTVGLPTTMSRQTILGARIPDTFNVSEVMLDDRRPVEWSVSPDNHQQLLKLVMPDSSPGTTLTISGTSVLPPSDTWNLPMVSFTHWQSQDGQNRGPILMPVSQMSVLLPASVQLDEWNLVGIQERDVVTRPDQSREYQLIQFLPEASAVVRTSSSQPRVSDAVVTLVEPAGRLATVRCLINVRCESSSVMELKWPVSVGWQVIAVRYASTTRSLFFEFPEPQPEANSTLLTVHLPEALEADSSRVFEVQLQQTDNVDPQTLSLPVQTSPGVDRMQSIVIFPPAFSLSSDLQRRWSTGRKKLTIEEIRRLTPWFPESRLVPTLQAFESGDSPASLASRSVKDGVEQHSILLEHAVRVTDGLIVEVSRLVLPADFASDESLTVIVPAESGADLRWSVDGEPVVAKRDELAQTASGWRRWIVPTGTRRIGVPGVIRCESRRTAAGDFLATVPMPESPYGVSGTLQLYSSDEGLLSVEGLVQESAADQKDSESRSTQWQLPAKVTAVRIRVDQNPRIEAGQTIDIHMLHLIGEQNGGLQREVLAVANVSRSAGQNSVPLSLPPQANPIVLVNGHRVQLQETETGFSIPLPASSADCQVLLTWTEPGDRPDRITGERQLPRLFLSELAVPQCTHHILVDPGLELYAPVSQFAAAEPTEIAHILDRLLMTSSSDSGLTQPSSSLALPAEVRQFVIRWQLAVVQGWQSQTLIDSVMAEAPIVIYVTQIRRRLAVAAGTFLVMIAFCIGSRQSVNRHRPATALLGTALLGGSFLVSSQIAVASLQGAFWGVSTGLILVIISQLKAAGRPERRSLVRAAGILSAWGLFASPLSAEPQQNISEARPVGDPAAVSVAEPDVILPESSIAGSELFYVRRNLLNTWRQQNARSRALAPTTVVRSLHSEIAAESAESVEIRLSLEVAAIRSSEQASLRIPLQGSRLVGCTVDGEKVLPEPDGTDAIRIPLPSSALIPVRTLETLFPEMANAEDAASTAVDAGPLAAFTMYQVECRLRPVISRQPSGVQFRMPTLPCPSATIEVVSPPDRFSRARAQGPDGIREWLPSEGVVPLTSLAMSDGIDIRLFQSGIEKGSPQLASVQILVINETISGQQILNCVCRFSKWNRLAPEVRYRVPQGYQLTTVSATTGADVVTDLLWSVSDQNATVQLPTGTSSEFTLSLQLVCQTPATVQNQPVPVTELQQFLDCVVSPSLLLAVRANPVFSVLPLEGEQITTVLFPDLQSTWGQWLRRSDSVFRVPSRNPVCSIRLAPRTSVNEVRLNQNVSIHEGQVDWKCQVDIETSVLPVFRHRLKLSTDIAVTDVQVVAGEANRLDSWHRRGDQLVIQLKEGTTGLHGITITGKQLLRPDDATLTLHSPHLQNAEVPLESTMTVTDEEGLGLTIVKLGGAVPIDRLQTNDILLPATPVRMQIVNEVDPVVFQRIRPVEPVGTIAAIQSVDRMTFALHITQWSGSLGPLHMDFADSAEFLTEPVVVADGVQLPLIRESNEFVAGQDVVRALFDRPEFTVVWTMPIRQADMIQDSAVFEWPSIFEGIRWADMFLVSLDTASGQKDELGVKSSALTWLPAAALAAGRDLTAAKPAISRLPLADSMADQTLRVPVLAARGGAVTDTVRNVLAVSDTIIWSGNEQSAVGETTLILFSARTPSRCTIQIPAETVVTELHSVEAIRWQDTDRKTIVTDITSPVTTVRLRWFSQRAGNEGLSTHLLLRPPYPSDCMLRRTATVISENGQRPEFRRVAKRLTNASLSDEHSADIEAGLEYAKPPDSAVAGNLFAPLPSRESLIQALNESRNRFLKGFRSAGLPATSMAHCRPSDSPEMLISIGRRPSFLTGLSLIAAFMVLAIAVFTGDAMLWPSMTTTENVREMSATGSTDRSTSRAVAQTVTSLPASGVDSRKSSLHSEPEKAPSSITQTRPPQQS